MPFLPINNFRSVMYCGSASPCSSDSKDDSGEFDNENLDEGDDGVWSPDIEHSFQEALAIYPPCGRRKIILPDEGKMYGRNELIARYIKLRTGKTRSRKQVSSHIQVLARRKTKEIHSQYKDDPVARDEVVRALQSMPSSHIVSSSVSHQPLPLMAQTSGVTILGAQQQHLDYNITPPPNVTMSIMSSSSNSSISPGHFMPITSQRLRVVDLSVHVKDMTNPLSSPHVIVNLKPTQIETPLEPIQISQFSDTFPREFLELHRRGPSPSFFLVKFWGDITSELIKRDGVSFELVAKYEGLDAGINAIEIRTQLVSFGNVAVEKIETPVLASRYQGDSRLGIHSRSSSCAEVAMGGASNFSAASSSPPVCNTFELPNSPLCGYMVKFIKTLSSLTDRADMNRVLENFCILQTITTPVTQSCSSELLLCLAYVFEVSQDRRPNSVVFRLVA